MESLVKRAACVSRALPSVCRGLSFLLRIQGAERVEEAGVESAFLGSPCACEKTKSSGRDEPQMMRGKPTSRHKVTLTSGQERRSPQSWPSHP